MQLFKARSPRPTMLDRLGLSLMVVGALLLLPSVAWAQFTVNTTQYKRTPTAERADAKLNLTISAADCAADGYYSVPISNATVGLTLAVRAGTCTAENYNEENECRLVMSASVTSANFTLELPFKKILVAQRALVDTCTDTNSTQDGCTEATACTDLENGLLTDVTLTFSIDKSSVPTATANWDVAWDLAGPAGPSGVKLGLGEEQLKVSWDALSDTDIDSYRFFCEPIKGSQTQSFEPMGPATGGAGGVGGTSAAGASAGGTGGLAGAGGSTGGTAGSSGAAAGAAGAGTAGAAGAAGADGTNGCAASALVPGEIPPAANACGSTSTRTATSGTVSGLTNFTTYTIGVAAVDNLGNIGTLSDLDCASPEPVDDFFEVYRRAGGKGGNGYCAINQSSTPGMLGLVLVAMGALIWRRRRSERN